MFDFPGGQVAAFCVTFAVGAGGCFLFRFLRVPSPGLLGSMAATGVLSAAGLYPPFDTHFFSFVANVMLGIMVGRYIDRTTVGQVARMTRLVLIQTIGMLVLSLVCGISMYLIDDSADLATSLISCTTGGIAEMIVFGMSVDADVSVIAFIQLFRLVVFLVLLPYLTLIAEKVTGLPQTAFKGNSNEEKVSVKFFKIKDYLMMIPLAIVGGAFALWLNVPAGAMLGALFACGGTALYLDKEYKFGKKLSLLVQISIGIVTGERIKPQFVDHLGALLVPAITVTLIMLLGCTLLAVLLHKASGWNYATCLLCTAPAGLSQVAPLAEDIGVDPLITSVFHTVRVICIVVFYPLLILPLIT